MNKIGHWWTFTKERFDPPTHSVMLVLFLFAHILVINATTSIFASSKEDIFLLVGITAFYFKLRLYDEVKDYELDVVINPHRPLPRGLLTHQDMYAGMFVCIIIELLCFSVQGFNSIISIIIPICYSLLMYKEFFIKEKIRPYLTTYALSHTIVTTLLSFAIFSFLSQKTFLQVMMDKTLFSFALANWMLFNLFEFGRKTFATEEERENVDTYSSLFGRTGAVVLVFSQALIAHYLSFNLVGANTGFMIAGFAAILFILGALSLWYISANNVKSAKLFRIFSSVYIILFYLILILAHIIP